MHQIFMSQCMDQVFLIFIQTFFYGVKDKFIVVSIDKNSLNKLIMMVLVYKVKLFLFYNGFTLHIYTLYIVLTQ